MIQRSMLKINSDYSIVFDLDDTIFYEKKYVLSGFMEIDKHLESRYGLKKTALKLTNYLEKKEKDPFQRLCQELNLNIKKKLIALMRESIPDIKTRPGIIQFIKKLKSKNFEIGIITNGRSITQRNKIQALGIQNYIDILLISDEVGLAKPQLEIFEKYELQSNKKKFLYIGNNPDLDINPAKTLGWQTVYCTSNNSMLKQYQSTDATWCISNFLKDSLNEIFAD